MMTKFLSLVLIVVALSPGIEGEQMQLGKDHVDGGDASVGRKLRSIQSIVSVPHFTHKLRVCNAFTDRAPVEVLHDRQGFRPNEQNLQLAVTNLTRHGLLPYKACQDFEVELVRHDAVEFRQRSAHLRSFSVSSLPQRNALLLLVLHNRGESSKPAFTSHVFSGNSRPQVVVLDMYSGSSKGHLAIEDSQPPAVTKEPKGTKGIEASSLQMEKLAYGTVVQVEAGDYDFVLVGGRTSAKVPIAMQDGQNYVAMRVGAEEREGFPEEVVAFPQSAALGRFVSRGLAVWSLLLSLFLPHI